MLVNCEMGTELRQCRLGDSEDIRSAKTPSSVINYSQMFFFGDPTNPQLPPKTRPAAVNGYKHT